MAINYLIMLNYNFQEDRMIDEVIEFNSKVLGIEQRKLSLLSEDEEDYLERALYEEFFEFQDAHTDGNIVGVVDGLLDLCYFAIGGLYRSGLTADQIKKCFAVIHQANMQKKIGVQAKRGGKAIDAIKPEGWKPPEELIKEILNL
jgi:predicted HAD superfamily Cof-like phosphohydrolase